MGNLKSCPATELISVIPLHKLCQGLPLCTCAVRGGEGRGKAGVRETPNLKQSEESFSPRSSQTTRRPALRCSAGGEDGTVTSALDTKGTQGGRPDLMIPSSNGEMTCGDSQILNEGMFALSVSVRDDV